MCGFRYSQTSAEVELARGRARRCPARQSGSRPRPRRSARPAPRAGSPPPRARPRRSRCDAGRPRPPARARAAAPREDPVGEREAAHRVLGVGDEAAVGRRDPVVGELLRQRRAAHEHRRRDAAPTVRSCAVVTICCALLTSRPERPIRSGRCSRERLDQLLGRHLDAEVDDLVAVVREDDLDQVLPDVVDVALDRREEHLALARAVALLHELLEVADRRLHRLGGLQHLGDDQLVGVEEPADLVHARPSAGR